jgi:hypothetical protein
MNFEQLARISNNAKEAGEKFNWKNISARHYHEIFKNYF